jgi:putative selenate reductase
MTDQMETLPIEQLLAMILSEYRSEGTILGIPGELFYRPDNKQRLQNEFLGQRLATPLGVAAGPHTQLAGNIIAAWLCGARLIELKTVQILDELVLTKPCISMEDEGYNCEWSQELKLEKSFDEYVNAWIILHVLHHLLGFDRVGGYDTVFVMSVGYNLAGVTDPKIQRFMDGLLDITALRERKIAVLRPFYPEIDQIAIDNCVSRTVCLSTMHGCPADEIEKIALHLIEDKKLHTMVKLNPTLLGARELRRILNDELNWPIEVADAAFQHDPLMPDVIAMLRRLIAAAQGCGVRFAVKLTNTLETVNHRQRFAATEKSVYMSGRALHPISVNVAAALQRSFAGELNMSFAGGVTSDNVRDVVAAGLAPVTMCSDLLKPGGYMRLKEYAERLERDAAIEHDLRALTAGERLSRLDFYSQQVVRDKAYYNDPRAAHRTKTGFPLKRWDCAHAPCTSGCPVAQQIPAYMRAAAEGRFHEGFDIILRSNPLARTTAEVCPQLCRPHCMRTHIDEPLNIRAVKRFVLQQPASAVSGETHGAHDAPRIAIIGAGPAGLAAASYLASQECHVEIFDKEQTAGGLLAHALPEFRLSLNAVNEDIRRVRDLGVVFHLGTRVDAALFETLRRDFRFVIVAAGLTKAKQLGVPGESLSGVTDHLALLKSLRRGEKVELGQKIVVIGGGDAAIDAARAARKIAGAQAEVSLLYRRDLNAMPASAEEVAHLPHDNIPVVEHVVCEQIIADESGRVKGVELVKTRYASSLFTAGRQRKLEPVAASQYVMPCDSVIVAIGQDAELDFARDDQLETAALGQETSLAGVYVAGDMLHGPATIIRAGGDGKVVAEAILKRLGSCGSAACGEESAAFARPLAPHYQKMAFRQRAQRFDLGEKAADAERVQAEAARCLGCDQICNACTTLCPNRALIAYPSDLSSYAVHLVQREGEHFSTEPAGVFKLTQAWQVVHLAELCNACGNCESFCPTGGAPYRDKNHLYLNAEPFARAENGYLMMSDGMIRKNAGQMETLFFDQEKWRYETDQVSLTLSGDHFEVVEARFKSSAKPCLTTLSAIEMGLMVRSLKAKWGVLPQMAKAQN